MSGDSVKKIPPKKPLIITCALSILLLLVIYLYNANLILVDYVEHGLLINKSDMGNFFKYDIYINGTPYSFATKDKSIDINPGVINFKARKNKLIEFSGYVKSINEKIMSKKQSSIELEYSGVLSLSKNPCVYKANEHYTSLKNLGSVIVGSDNVKLYKNNNGDIKTIIIEDDTKLNFIRVGIKNNEFQSFLHEKLEFISEGAIKIADKRNRWSTIIPPKTRVAISSKKDGMQVESNNLYQIATGRFYISSLDASGMMSILSYKRGYGTPRYRGVFEITQSGDMLRIVNELGLDNYLYQVVPSEMPSSFGFEALKAQAVAARTYAVSDLLSNRYAESGFHVDDSTMSQVYNNIEENPLSKAAVDETMGLIMKYEDELVDAKYYSTSHGYGANSDEIWSSNGSFPGIKKPYLTAKSYLLNGEQYDLSTEEVALTFFKNWSLQSLDLASPYFRWKALMTGEELKNTIEKNLPLVYKNQQNYILTLRNGKFGSHDIPKDCIGVLTDIRVEKRGGGGNIMELVIYGKNGTYKVVKELNVRYVLRPRKSDTGSSNDILIKRVKGDDLKNSSLLPSAFMSLETSRDSEGNVKLVTIYGGGYGHSVGMSQYGAGYLSSKGYSFDKILRTYYSGINIEKLY